jgi:hypothetical protein
LQPDQQQQQPQQIIQQQQYYQAQQQPQQHLSTVQELPACEQHAQELGYPFNSVLRQLHMERLQRLEGLGCVQHAPGTPS